MRNLIIVAIFGILAIPAIPPAGAASWPTLMGDEGRTGFLTNVSVQPVGWRSGLEGRCGPIDCGVVVDASHVYITYPTVTALHLSTGAIVWEFAPENTTLAGTAALAGDRIVAVGRSAGPPRSEIAVALDALSGRVVWWAHWPIEGQAGRVHSPVVSEDAVIVPLADGLASLDLNNGSIGWRVVDVADAGTPTIARGVIYYGDSEGVVRARALDSTLIWSRPLHDEILAAPLVTSDTVVVNDRRNMTALSRATGDVLWTIEMPWPTLASPALWEDSILMASGSTVLSIALRDGHLQWTTDVPGSLAPGVAVSGGELAAWQSNGELAFLDAGNGDVIARFHTDTRRAPAPPAWNGEQAIVAGGARSPFEPATHIISLLREDADTPGVATSIVLGLLLLCAVLRPRRAR